MFESGELSIGQRSSVNDFIFHRLNNICSENDFNDFVSLCYYRCSWGV